MKTLYLDCFSGISGDMVIGSLLDAGGDFKKLQDELKKLPIDEEYTLKVSKVIKNGIHSTTFDVILKNGDGNQEKHDHTEHRVHHHENEQPNFNHDHNNGDDHHVYNHTHHHEHDDIHRGHHHVHRTYKDIVHMIESAGFTEKVEKTALAIFKKIGEAEGKIHNLPLGEVHFHEVGAIDSIIDIVGTAILIHQLEIDSIQCSPVPLGSGKISIDHGIYPVPAPATLEIMRGLPIEASNLKGELTTPTGAGIVAVLTEDFNPSIPPMTLEKVGYGAGTKSFENHPNVLRTVIGKV